MDGTSVICKLYVKESSVTSMTVDCQERLYAINKIPGGFTKKECKNKESELISAKIIQNALTPSIDPTFCHHVIASVVVTHYPKNAPFEALAINALSALMRYAGIPANVVGAESLTYNKDKQEWRTPANDNAFLIVAGCGQGVYYMYYTGPELNQNILNKGTALAYQKAYKKIAHTYQILPTFKSDFKYKHQESKAFLFDAKEIVNLYLAGDSAAISEKKNTFISNWDHPVGHIKWRAAVNAILKAHFSWHRTRLAKRELDAFAETFADYELTKHTASCMIKRNEAEAVSIGFVTTANGNEHQIVDSLAQENNRKFILQTNNIGEQCKSDNIDASFIRNGIKNYIGDDKFTRVVVENLMQSDFTCATIAAICSLKASGARFTSAIAPLSIGLIINNMMSKSIVDIIKDERDLLVDAHCNFIGSKNGISVFDFITTQNTCIPLAAIEQMFIDSDEYLKQAVNKVIELEKHKKKHTNNNNHAQEDKSQSQKKDKEIYTLQLSQKALSKVKEEISKLREIIKCSIILKDNTISLEGKNIHQSINTLLTEIYRPADDLEFQALYAKVVKFDERYAHCKLLDGREIKLKRANLKKEVNEKSGLILVWKGRSWLCIDACL